MGKGQAPAVGGLSREVANLDKGGRVLGKLAFNKWRRIRQYGILRMVGDFGAAGKGMAVSSIPYYYMTYWSKLLYLSGTQFSSSGNGDGIFMNYLQELRSRLKVL